MYKAEYSEESTVVGILTRAYADNKGPNLIIKQDAKREYRLAKLVEYIFELCFAFGEVFLSQDKKSCALILYPEKRKGLKSIIIDFKIIVQCIGLRKLKSVLLAEIARKKIRPKTPISYLWQIAVVPEYQQKGLGSILMEKVTQYSFSQQRPLYFEAVIPQNVEWYKKLGFTVYQEADLNCKVFFIKKDIPA